MLGAEDEAGFLFCCRRIRGFEAGVEEGVVVKGEREGFDDEGEVGEFGLVRGGGMSVQASSERGEGGDVKFVGVNEMRDLEGASHGFEHLRLDRGESDWSFGL